MTVTYREIPMTSGCDKIDFLLVRLDLLFLFHYSEYLNKYCETK